MNTCISAVQYLRPLRVGAHSHLLKASDGACYVTKLQNNPPTHPSARERDASHQLGSGAWAPMPRVEVIEVSDWFIEPQRDSESSWVVPRFRVGAARNWARCMWAPRVPA